MAGAALPARRRASKTLKLVREASFLAVVRNVRAHLALRCPVDPNNGLARLKSGRTSAPRLPAGRADEAPLNVGRPAPNFVPTQELNVSFSVLESS